MGTPSPGGSPGSTATGSRPWSRATATWTLSTLQAALRRAADGLPTVSTHTLWRTLHEAGLSWQRTRTWCSAGTVVRTRKHGGVVTVTDGDAAAKKS